MCPALLCHAINASALPCHAINACALPQVPEADDMTTRALLVRTKRLVVDAIRFQQGRTLLEILQTEATPEVGGARVTLSLGRASVGGDGQGMPGR